MYIAYFAYPCAVYFYNTWQLRVGYTHTLCILQPQVAVCVCVCVCVRQLGFDTQVYMYVLYISHSPAVSC